jgi:DNA polymerase-1
VVLQFSEPQDKTEQIKTAKKRKATAKKVETLDEAFERLADLKWDPAVWADMKTVRSALEDGTLKRRSTGRLTKKELMELRAELEQLKRQRLIQHVIDTKPDNYWIVQDVKTLMKVAEMLESEPETGWDTETQGLDIFNHRIVGYSIYMPKADVAVYIPFGHTTGQKQVSEELALEVARDYLQNPNNRTIWHHYKYDGHMFANHGIRIANPYWDTQVVSKLLNENEPSHRLKDLHAKYILRAPDKAVMFEDLFDDAVIYDKDVLLAGVYACGDPHKTYQLYQFQKPYIDTRDNLKTVWYQIEQKLLQVDLDMERTGFRINLEELHQLQERFEPIIEQAERDIRTAFNIDEQFVQKMSEHFGKPVDDFNIQSPQHLAYLLYDVLGVDPELGLKFRKSIRSTASDVIDAACEDHEQLEPIKRYRQLVKLLSTYIRKIPEAMEPATGRLHARFNNLAGDDGSDGTATGRYSSSTYVSGKHSATGDKPKGTNLQNISSKGEGVLIRRCFMPDDGWIFISSDLSQIEPRIIATILSDRYGDHSMRDMYIQGVDLYTTSAMRTFGFAEEYCVDGAYDPTHSFKPRKLMKQGVLSYLYGSSARSFARAMKVSDEVAEQFFDGMITAFPGLQDFRDDILTRLLRDGNVAASETLFGRKRRFPTYRNDYAELQKLGRFAQTPRRRELWGRCAKVQRQAVNAVVQGSAADCLKQIMIAMHRLCVQNGYKLHASIHDELMISVPLSELSPELIAEIDRIMTQTVTFSTPLKCDTVIQPRWMEEYRAEEWDFARQRPKDEAILKKAQEGEPVSYAVGLGVKTA